MTRSIEEQLADLIARLAGILESEAQLNYRHRLYISAKEVKEEALSIAVEIRQRRPNPVPGPKEHA